MKNITISPKAVPRWAKQKNADAAVARYARAQLAAANPAPAPVPAPPPAFDGGGADWADFSTHGVSS